MDQKRRARRPCHSFRQRQSACANQPAGLLSGQAPRHFCADAALDATDTLVSLLAKDAVRVPFVVTSHLTDAYQPGKAKGRMKKFRIRNPRFFLIPNSAFLIPPSSVGLGYQGIRRSLLTWSKCSSRESTGKSCCKASAAIQTSFIGIIHPRLRRSATISA